MMTRHSTSRHSLPISSLTDSNHRAMRDPHFNTRMRERRSLLPRTWGRAAITFAIGMIGTLGANAASAADLVQVDRDAALHYEQYASARHLPLAGREAPPHGPSRRFPPLHDTARGAVGPRPVM